MPLEYCAWITLFIAALFYAFGVVSESRPNPPAFTKYSGSIVMFLVLVGIALLNWHDFGAAVK